MIKGEYHIFSALELHDATHQTYHVKVNSKTNERVILRTIRNRKPFEEGKIPQLFEIFYVKKLNMIVATDPDIQLSKTSGDYSKCI